MFHSRPRAGRTRLSTLLSTSLHARNRSRTLTMYGCPRRLAKNQLDRGGAALINSPQHDLGSYQSQAQPDTRRNIQNSAPRASGHSSRTARASTRKSLTHPPSNPSTKLAQVADTVRLTSSLMEPSFILEHLSYSTSAPVCITWSRLIRHTAETHIGALVGLAQSWVLRAY